MNYYKVYWSNMGYFSDRTFATLEEAKAYVKERFFEAQIYFLGEGEAKLVASWQVFGGWRNHEEW